MVRLLFLFIGIMFLNLGFSQSGDFKELVSDLYFEMVFVEGGTFIMGCTDEQLDFCRENEKPAHEVKVSDFYISKFPVTRRLYNAVMGRDLPGAKGCMSCPLESVNWFEANEFIDRLNELTGKNYRLPSEAEWEYAARGGKNMRSTVFSGGNTLSDVGWYQKSKLPKLKPVGLKQPNELGLYEMSGGVWEWCMDYYDNYPSEEGSKRVDPVVDGGSRFKIVRGGSWAVVENHCRVSSRHRYFPNIKTYDVGFRVVYVE